MERPTGTKTNINTRDCEVFATATSHDALFIPLTVDRGPGPMAGMMVEGIRAADAITPHHTQLTYVSWHYLPA